MKQLTVYKLLLVLMLVTCTTVCQAKDAEVFLILRIPDDNVDIYETVVVGYKSPRVYNGKIQVFAKPAEVGDGLAWQADKTLSVIHFPNEDLARQWYRFSSDDLDQTWIINADVVLQKMDAPLPGKDKTALLLMLTTINNATAFFNNYVDMAEDALDVNGWVNGATGNTTNQWEVLKGSWPVVDNKLYLQVAFITNTAAAHTLWSSDDFADALSYQQQISSQDVYTCERSVDLQGEDYGVYVIVRLPSDRLDNYIDLVLGEKSERNHTGKVQVFAKNGSEIVTLVGELWPADKALSVIYFTNQPAVRQWYNQAKQDVDQSWTDQADLALQPLTMELPPSEKKALVLSLTPLSEEFFSQYMPPFTELFESDKYDGTGGATGDSTMRWTALGGSWPDDSYLQIFHSSSTEKAIEFYDSDDYVNGPKNLADQSATSMDVYTMVRHEDLIKVRPSSDSASSVGSLYLITIIGLAITYSAR